jgi:hypothetical protein
MRTKFYANEKVEDRIKMKNYKSDLKVLQKLKKETKKSRKFVENEWREVSNKKKKEATKTLKNSDRINELISEANNTDIPYKWWEVAVFGFNSSKFDMNLLNKYLNSDDGENSWHIMEEGFDEWWCFKVSKS